MSDLETFRRELGGRVAAAARAGPWSSAEFDRYMADLQPRRKRFDEMAASLVTETVTSRLEALVELFPSSRLMADQQANRCACWFAQSDRFPVTAKLEFAIEHDEALHLGGIDRGARRCADEQRRCGRGLAERGDEREHGDRSTRATHLCECYQPDDFALSRMRCIRARWAPLA